MVFADLFVARRGRPLRRYFTAQKSSAQRTILERWSYVSFAPGIHGRCAWAGPCLLPAGRGHAAYARAFLSRSLSRKTGLRVLTSLAGQTARLCTHCFSVSQCCMNFTCYNELEPLHTCTCLCTLILFFSVQLL